MSANTNCLAGMKCPKCDSLEPFSIVCKIGCLVYDDGTDLDHSWDTEWDADSYCRCHECEFEGIVHDFKAQETRKVCIEISWTESSEYNAVAEVEVPVDMPIQHVPAHLIAEVSPWFEDVLNELSNGCSFDECHCHLKRKVEHRQLLSIDNITEVKKV